MEIDFIKEHLLHEMSKLKYSFKETTKFFELKVNQKLIKFEKDKGKFNSHYNYWFNFHHNEGNIHEKGMIAIIIALSKLFDNQKVIFYDIGALYGYHSIIAKNFFKNIEINTVEGNPITHKKIKSKTSNYLNFKNYNYVLGDIPETNFYSIIGYSFYKCNFFKAWIKNINIIFKNLIKIILNFFNFNFRINRIPKIFKLSTITLGNLLIKKNEDKIEILKIDTEGYQAKFLPPYASFLADRKAILLMEIDNKDVMAKHGLSNNELVKIFLKLNYKAIWIDHRTGKGISIIKSINKKQDKNSLVILVPGKN